MMRLMRIGLGFGLVVLLAVVIFGPETNARTTPIVVDSETSAASLSEVIARRPQVDLVYSDSVPPTRAVATLLAGAAGTAGPLSAVRLYTPSSLPALQVLAPVNSVAMRRSTLEVTLRGEPNTEVDIVLDDAAGSVDTVSVMIGSTGVVTTDLAVEATREGQSVWSVRAKGESVTVRAWTQPEQQVRVLVLSGPPTWESRFLIRAWESSGASVTSRQSLGRQQVVASTRVRVPTNPDDLTQYDVVAVVGTVSGLSEDLLHSWVSNQGGGLIRISTPSPSSLESRTARVETLRWSGPAELIPLPAPDMTLTLVPMAPGPGAIPIVWTGSDFSTPEAVYSTAEWRGRGRVMTTSLETWRWVMEAGLPEAHVDHWESVLEWLAGGLHRGSYLVGHTGQPSTLWQGRLIGGSASDLSAEEEGTSPPPSPLVYRFVPSRTGGHPLTPDGSIGANIAPAEDRLSWLSAALEIGRAGGEVHNLLNQEPLRLLSPVDDSSPWPLLGFLLLGTVAIAGWAVRRLNGLP